MSSNPSHRPRTRSSTKRSRVETPPPVNQSTRIQVGNFGSQLSQLTNSEQEACLFGSIPPPGTPRHQTLELISQFLAQQELARAATPLVDNHIATASYYLPTLQEFAETQLDRQAAGLRTNADRETAVGATLLVQGHAQALQMALQEPLSSLCSNASICTIHTLLLNGQEGSGEFRTTLVRAGQTVFCPPEDIIREMDQFWSRIIQLSKTYSQSITSNTDVTKIYNSIALAATAMYAINDIHPFVDGNGRTSRIYVNALLKQFLQLPFTITIVATPQQRQEYVEGLREGQRILEDRGAISPSSGAAVEPLINMLMDRIVHAVIGLRALLKERATTALDDEEARIARRVRERAAQGQCVICLDAHPNIATLCCGQAVHLNCIAEWLANGTTCVSCRKPLPRLSVPDREPPRENDHTNNSHNAFQVVQDAVQRAIQLQNQLDGVHQNITEDFPEDNTDVPPQCPHCQNRAAIDCNHGMCGRCCASLGRGNCERHGTVQNHDTTSIGDDDDNTTQVEQCTTCNDICANDCPNHMCARCCMTLGRYGCERHRGPPTDDETEEDNQSETTEIVHRTQNNSPYCRECRRNRAAMDCNNIMCGRCCVMKGLAHRCNRHGA